MVVGGRITTAENPAWFVYTALSSQLYNPGIASERPPNLYHAVVYDAADTYPCGREDYPSPPYPVDCVADRGESGRHTPDTSLLCKSSARSRFSVSNFSKAVCTSPLSIPRCSLLIERCPRLLNFPEYRCAPL